jgi:hypothetical protein
VSSQPHDRHPAWLLWVARRVQLITWAEAGVRFPDRTDDNCLVFHHFRCGAVLDVAVLGWSLMDLTTAVFWAMFPFAALSILLSFFIDRLPR